MTEVLAFQRFAAQGGDWGGFTAACLGALHAEKLIGIHVNMLAVRRDASLFQNPTPEEQDYRGKMSTG